VRERFIEHNGVLFSKRTGKIAGTLNGYQKRVIIIDGGWFPHDEILAIFRGEPLPQNKRPPDHPTSAGKSSRIP